MIENTPNFNKRGQGSFEKRFFLNNHAKKKETYCFLTANITSNSKKRGLVFLTEYHKNYS